MLDAWWKKQDNPADAPEKLRDALQAVDRADLASQVPGTAGATFDVDQCARELAAHYRETMKVTTHPKEKHMAREMDDMYVNLQLLEETNIPSPVSSSETETQAETVSQSEHLKASKRAIDVNRMGKKFDIIDAIFSQILTDSKLKKRDLEQYIHDNPERVLILLDGADEISLQRVKDAQCKNGFDLNGVLSFKSLKSCKFFMDVYGWRGALMLIGSILLHLAVCGALLRTHPVTNQRDGDYAIVTNTSSDDKTIRDKFRILSVLTSMKNAVNIDLFALSGYWLVVLISIFTTVAATAWFVYFTAHTNQYKGFSLSEVVAFVSVFGVGKILGNLAVAFIGGYQFIGMNLLMGLAVTVSSACFLTDLLLESYWPIMAYVFVYGFFQSFIYTLLDVMTKETVGVERLGSALGWIGLKCGFVRALFLFLPGLIYDTLGSYTVAFILMAFLNALALPVLLVLMKLQRCN
ncbi:monocarboxylate transporter 12-like [Patiria miniata]|uniref:Death domain-containing protein n=1 Tax=Patiria miniata TaxID=46514 RepID=A0A913ZDC1_PATMI|nr:monocarboxylate transporter 12-like [Patiria miniata]